jgi:uncharacterized protein (TIGR02246 family)
LVAIFLPPSSDDAKAQSGPHEEAITKAYADWVQTVNARDLVAWASFLAPDAIFLPPDSPVLTDRQAILDLYAALFADDKFTLSCRQENVEVSESEDLAWSHGHCESTLTDPDGRLARGTSKWMKVWKRQPNGDWKCAANSWSSTAPDLTLRGGGA